MAKISLSPERLPNMLLIHLALFLQFGIKDIVKSEKTEIHHEIISAEVGEPLALTCTYNCSSGFIRAKWVWEKMPKTPCATCNWEEKNRTKTGDVCTLILFTQLLTPEQTLYNYSCVSEESDHPKIPRKTERQISLQVHDPATPSVIPPGPFMKVMVYRDGLKDSTATSATPKSVKAAIGESLKLSCLTGTVCEAQWRRENGTLPRPRTGNGATLHWDEIKEEDAGSYMCHAQEHCTKERVIVKVEVTEQGSRTWAMLSALTAMSVAVVLALLAVFFCLQNKRRCIGDLSASSNKRQTSNNGVNKITVIDCPSDHEVPYADIVISVRGSSNPELTDTPNRPTRDHRPCWREETGATSLLYTCRSADRLHIQSREVSRKMSTTSEYAIITYSPDALS